MKLIGLSCALCIKDICKGNVNIEDIECIITGTMAETFDHWLGVYKVYNKTYWSKYPTKAFMILGYLLGTDRIYQPRLYKQDAPFAGGDIWIEIKD